MTALRNPTSITIPLNTQEDVLALFLRFNLTPADLSEFYHDLRDRADVVIPDLRTRSLYKTLKNVMASEGFSHIRPVDAPPAVPAPPASVGLSVSLG
jgi:hypothetical protein